MKTIDLIAAARQGLIATKAGDPVAAVSLLETTHCLCNQLLRDRDWASVGHTLALCTHLAVLAGYER
jgi:hypothetical protein